MQVQVHCFECTPTINHVLNVSRLLLLNFTPDSWLVLARTVSSTSSEIIKCKLWFFGALVKDFFNIQSPLVIVYLVIVESLIIVDMFSWPIVYFSLHLSRNSGFSCNSGHFEDDGRIHYYQRRLYYEGTIRWGQLIKMWCGVTYLYSLIFFCLFIKKSNKS